MATKARAGAAATTLDLGGAVAAPGGGAKGLYRDAEAKVCVRRLAAREGRGPRAAALALARPCAAGRRRGVDAGAGGSTNAADATMLTLRPPARPPARLLARSPATAPCAAGRRVTTSCTTSASCAAAPTRCP